MYQHGPSGFFFYQPLKHEFPAKLAIQFQPTWYPLLDDLMEPGADTPANLVRRLLVKEATERGFNVTHDKIDPSALRGPYARRQLRYTPKPRGDTNV
jgi:hypothetical protein